MAQVNFSIKESLDFGWKTTQANFGLILGAGLIMVIASVAPEKFIKSLEVTSPVLALLLSLASAFISFLVSIGFYKMILKMIDGEKAEIADLFAYPHLVLRYFGASILYGLAILGGLICLIVPGFILMMRLQFYMYLIVDKNMGAVESLSQSFAMTNGSVWRLLTFMFVIALVNLLGLLCLIVGLLVTLPLTAIAHVYVYRIFFPPQPAAQVV